MKKFSKILENNDLATDDILIVVDVQQEFSDHIPINLVKNLQDYSKNFKHVYQIYDTNKVPMKPLYKFENDKNKVCENIPKRFGHKWFDDNLLKYIETIKKQKDFNTGKLFKVGDTDTFVLYNDKHNHKWFFINNELVNLCRKLEGKNITVVGGADHECLLDVFLMFKRFGINPTYNHKYIYSAQSNKY